MDSKRKPIEILLVEDSPTDKLIAIEALSEARVLNNLHTVDDGVEAMAFLRREGKYANSPVPDLILLDLNLPRKDGREVLAEIKNDPRLRVIPVVVLTTSEAEEDVYKAYAGHANCYILKPVDFNQFTKVVKTIEDFWFEVVRFARPAAAGLPSGAHLDGLRRTQMPSGPVRVLVVEDSPTDRLLIEAALSEGASHAFELVHAQRISEAAEKLEQRPFDIILTDLNLPDSSGLDTFRRVYVAAKGIPVIVLTANDDEETGIQALQQGAQDYLVKGQTTFPMFSRAIRYAMERSQLLAQIRQASRMDAIGQLAGSIANDFNNLITVIRSHASLLLAEGDSHHENGSVKEIAQAAERVAGLTRQLLTFSQRHSFHPRPTDLNDVVGTTQKFVSRLAGDRISVELRLGSQLPVISADPTLIEQAIMDLVLNARDAMPSGGKLSISTDPAEVDEATARHYRGAYGGRFVRLTVTDTGCGIPASVMERVFEPFVTTKDLGAGSGLGLATVYGIVHQHRGWLRVESAPGKGTTFEIYLPRARADEVGEPAAARSGATARGSETILIVEDESMLRQVMSLLLRKQGYQVIEAMDAEEALEHWGKNKQKINLVVTDLSIPDGMSGIELATVLRKDRADLRVIFSSGYGAQTEPWPEKLIEGANFLPKPYQSNDLTRIVRRCLDTPAA